MRHLRGLAVVWVLCASAQPASADVARPPGTGTAPVAGRIHLCGGAGARIKVGRTEFAPLVGMPLLKSDELVVPLGEFLVVALGNGYLVRIDEDLTMRVSDIVLLGAPPARESMAVQLDRLVSQAERTQAKRMNAERVAGVQSRASAAEAMPAQPADLPVRTTRGRPRPAPGGAAPPAPVSTSAAPAPSPPPPPVTASAPSPPPPPSRDVDELLEEQKTQARAEAERAAQARAEAEAAQRAMEAARRRAEAERMARAEREEAPKPTTAAPAQSGDPLAGIDTAPTLPALPAQAELRQCLKRSLGTLPVQLDRVTVLVRVKNGRITQVALGGGVPVPACARTLLMGRSFAAPEAMWLRYEITLR